MNCNISLLFGRVRTKLKGKGFSLRENPLKGMECPSNEVILFLEVLQKPERINMISKVPGGGGGGEGGEIGIIAIIVIDRVVMRGMQ